METRNNQYTIEYNVLKNLLKDYASAIDANIHLMPIISTEFGFGTVRYRPPSINAIDKAFDKKDFHKITKILISFSNAVSLWDSRKSLYLLEAALESPLIHEIYKQDFLKITLPILCGSQLTKARDEMVGHIDKTIEKKQAIARFNKI